MPGSASAWLKADARGTYPGRGRCIDDWVVPDRACERIRRSTPCLDRTRSSDFHVDLPIQLLDSLIGLS